MSIPKAEVLLTRQEVSAVVYITFLWLPPNMEELSVIPVILVQIRGSDVSRFDG